MLANHTPLEGLSGSVQSPRQMTFTQLFFGISGIQNRFDQNFLPRTFSVIAILRHLTFPYCFYYIAILLLCHFRWIFTNLLVTSKRIYLGFSNFLAVFLTSIGICWGRKFWNHANHFTTRGLQSVEGRAKTKADSL